MMRFAHGTADEDADIGSGYSDNVPFECRYVYKDDV